MYSVQPVLQRLYLKPYCTRACLTRLAHGKPPLALSRPETHKGALRIGLKAKRAATRRKLRKGRFADCTRIITLTVLAARCTVVSATRVT